MQENDGIIVANELLGRNGAPCADTEIVYEADCFLLQWDSGASWGY